MKKRLKSLLTFIVVLLLFITNLTANTVYAKEEYLYLGGFTCGFNLKTRGATVVGITDVLTNSGVASPSKSAGLEIGDIILSINGKEINGVSDFTIALNDFDGGFIITEILRNNTKKLLDVYPEKDVNGKYRIGVLLREDLQGLGTVTYIYEVGNFGALGHPVANANGKNYDVIKGEVYNCSIIGVNKATRGRAGELKGMFIGEKPIGEISSNENVGLFGKLNDISNLKGDKISIGNACVGKAQILSTIDGQTKESYDIEIIKTDYKKGNNKNLVIKITDKDLLNKTGGILQGMSGSPIIQNNRLVGAVTHVFLNDSSRGFGISINNMLNYNKEVA